MRKKAIKLNTYFLIVIFMLTLTTGLIVSQLSSTRTANGYPWYVYPLGICNRSYKVQEAILDYLEYSFSKKYKRENCMDVTPSDLERVFRLDLSYKKIKQLHKRDFAGLPFLEVLYLNNNQLETLPLGIFDELSSLKKLDLYKNKISFLPKNLFFNLSSLRWLILSFNNLENPEPGLFAGLYALETLLYSSNPIHHLRKGVLDELHSLQWLQLNNAQLEILDAGLFDSFSNLRWFQMTHNSSLRDLPDRLFSPLSSIEVIYLSNNDLGRNKNQPGGIPRGLVADLPTLRGLSLVGNNLSHLSDKSLDELFALQSFESLDLYNNNISTEERFRIQGRLSHIDIRFEEPDYDWRKREEKQTAKPPTPPPL